ncbi:response regulator transcription factor [Nocardiopsis tropica]|uniref:Response regulator transcription factor n=1 Tax=Nocardiopsis tropica TaxID=109330 RepID=A0ABU7KX78_9ACTN|nr:response regulator transcription factor [Nocardiopsis umidischolae]MEE2053885.1 response regulator transcription factor [Nocardiopsis umidischolae]
MIRVLLAEDLVILRQALRKTLALTPDIRVVAECHQGEEVRTAAEEADPDVAVIDVQLPGISGFDAAEELTATLPRCRTLFMTSYATPANLRRALRIGALGFIGKDVSPDYLAEAIRSVKSGVKVYDPGIVADAMTYDPGPLTARETQILEMSAKGEPAKSVARALSLAEGTVHNYLRSCIVKIGARNRTDAYRIAKENGWIH